MAYSTIVMKALALVLFAATVAASCPDKHQWKSLEGHTSLRNITIGSHNRSYLLHIPEGFSNTEHKVGVVFSYHEKDKDAYYQERISGFSDPALNNKYVAVYPQSIGGTWYPGPSSGENSPNVFTTSLQDHNYTSAILDELYTTKGLCLDSTQAYATGMGNGSSFIHHLNCHNVDGHPFQAFAGVAGVPQTLDMASNRCLDAGFKPLLMIHGAEDNEGTQLQTSNGTTLPNLDEHSLAAAWAFAGDFKPQQKPIISIVEPQGLKFNWTK